VTDPEQTTAERMDVLLDSRTQMIAGRPDRQRDPLVYARWNVGYIELLTELLPLYGLVTGRCAGGFISDWTPNEYASCRNRATQPEFGLCAHHLKDWRIQLDHAPVQQSRAETYEAARVLAAQLTRLGFAANPTGDGGVHLDAEVTRRIFDRIRADAEVLDDLLDAVTRWRDDEGSDDEVLDAAEAARVYRDRTWTVVRHLPRDDDYTDKGIDATIDAEEEGR
jgi:hypothetical protein